jgi:hypothetical protein
MALTHWTPIVAHPTQVDRLWRHATALSCWSAFNHSAIRFQLAKFELTSFPNLFMQWALRTTRPSALEVAFRATSLREA